MEVEGLTEALGVEDTLDEGEILAEGLPEALGL